MKIALAALAVLILAAAMIALREHQRAPSPDVQRIARKYTAALGGYRRVSSIRTREIRGTFEYRGIQQHGAGAVQMQWRAPNSLVEQLDGPLGRVMRGFDGVRAWGFHPQAGKRKLSSAEIDEIRLEAAFYQPIIMQRHETPKYRGIANLHGRTTEIVTAKRRGGRTDRFYFDPESGLPIQLDLWEEGPEAVRRPGRFYLAHYELRDYRYVDGVAIPFQIRRIRPNSTMVFRFTEVRQNVPLPDSIFTL
jgi:hypothetical protein